MRFSGYMFIRNGIRAGYTFMEAIENVLPFVDEFYVLEGNSDDGTKEALAALASFCPKVRLESREPKYISAPKDKRALLLGEVFDEARRACCGDWLVQVQADTVFHPATMLASRAFLERGTNARKYGALEIVREQYRWNWQEMYRRDHLALIFRKEACRVVNDAINVAVEGHISQALVPVFEKYPAADNAWVFFANLAGKMSSWREISGPASETAERPFPWYDAATGRSFAADLAAYRTAGVLPPFWLEKKSPFAGRLPPNLAPLVGKAEYSVDGRFNAPGGLYSPSPEEKARLLAGAGDLREPLRDVIACLFK